MSMYMLSSTSKTFYRQKHIPVQLYMYMYEQIKCFALMFTYHKHS